jgi:hypothetical protein
MNSNHIDYQYNSSNILNKDINDNKYMHYTLFDNDKKDNINYLSYNFKDKQYYSSNLFKD